MDTTRDSTKGQEKKYQGTKQQMVQLENASNRGLSIGLKRLENSRNAYNCC